MFREVALPAVAYAEGSVDEELQFASYGLAYLPDRFQRRFALDDQTRVSQALMEARVPGGAYRALRGRVQGDGDVVPLRDGGVLDYECVHSGRLRLQHQPVRPVQFVVKQDRVDCQEYAGSEAVRVLAEPRHVLHTVPGIFPGSELPSGHIHGIGTAVDGCDADVGISRRCEKFE